MANSVATRLSGDLQEAFFSTFGFNLLRPKRGAALEPISCSVYSGSSSHKSELQPSCCKFCLNASSQICLKFASSLPHSLTNWLQFLHLQFRRFPGRLTNRSFKWLQFFCISSSLGGLSEAGRCRFAASDSPALSSQVPFFQAFGPAPRAAPSERISAAKGSERSAAGERMGERGERASGRAEKARRGRIFLNLLSFFCPFLFSFFFFLIFFFFLFFGSPTNPWPWEFFFL